MPAPGRWARGARRAGGGRPAAWAPRAESAAAALLHLVGAVAAALVVVAAPRALRSVEAWGSVAGCRVFPSDNAWNTPVKCVPVGDDERTPLPTAVLAPASRMMMPKRELTPAPHGPRHHPPWRRWPARTPLHHPNLALSTLPVHPYNSDIMSILTHSHKGLKADFGSGTWQGYKIGIPFTVVPSTQPVVTVDFSKGYWDESDTVPGQKYGLYPVPPTASVEGPPPPNGDGHVLVLQQGKCMLYELYQGIRGSGSSWTATGGAVFNLSSNAMRPLGWTSADAAGLSLFAGLVKYDEVVGKGDLGHALRFTSTSGFILDWVWPGSHRTGTEAGGSPDTCAQRTLASLSIAFDHCPSMGLRVRLKSTFNEKQICVDTATSTRCTSTSSPTCDCSASFNPIITKLIRTMKRYGLILADGGSDFYVSGAPDERWDNDVLQQFRYIWTEDFEAVDASSFMIDANSYQSKQPPSVAPTASPTFRPSAHPSKAPSRSPTLRPTRPPTFRPSLAPTTSKPSQAPTTSRPSLQPTTSKPSKAPTHRPSAAPTTSHPTRSPSSSKPSKSPTTARPSRAPTPRPTKKPTTSKPSRSPTTSKPSRSPATSKPSKAPTLRPTRSPLTSKPSKAPSTARPSKAPAQKPASSG